MPRPTTEIVVLASPVTSQRRPIEDMTDPKSIRQKVLLDIFAAPGTLIPFIGGVTALIGSWAFGGNGAMTFAGVMGVLGSFGILASRLIFGLDKLTNEAYQHQVQKQQEAQFESLRSLDQRLEQDSDPRTEACLRELWQLYRHLQEKVDSGKVATAGLEVVDRVDLVFTCCVEQLEHTLELYESASKVSGPAREAIVRQRDELVREVRRSVDHLGETVNQFLATTTEKNRSKLAQLRSELDESLEVARRAEERVESIGRKNYDPSEFE